MNKISSSSILNKIAERSKKGYQEVEKSMVLATQIADAMERAGLTKKQLADRMGKQPSEITKWLSGTHNFTTKTLDKIECAIGVKLDSAVCNSGTYKLTNNKYAAVSTVTMYNKPKMIRAVSFIHKTGNPKFNILPNSSYANAACLI